ncbi:hypothetical protein [Shewanella woodyi]|uniref:hypothetical protein n=1 Tax=Shewanella woodyi TaxID=60961 RepID=UPI0007F92424|nr:hypothetical protein [Shewanella woodyi]
MNREEELAKQYLKNLPSISLDFEPDGNVPPDFLMNDSIAIEVTRLNEHIEIQGVLKRFDDESFSIIAYVENILNSFNSAINGTCFWASINIKRPFGNRKKTKKKLIELLKSFDRTQNVNCRLEYPVTNGLSVSFIEGTFDPSAPVFRLGGIDEHDSGGWVYEDVATNSMHCINTKSLKVSPY